MVTKTRAGSARQTFADEDVGNDLRAVVVRPDSDEGPLYHLVQLIWCLGEHRAGSLSSG